MACWIALVEKAQGSETSHIVARKHKKKSIPDAVKLTTEIGRHKVAVRQMFPCPQWLKDFTQNLLCTCSTTFHHWCPENQHFSIRILGDIYSTTAGNRCYVLCSERSSNRQFCLTAGLFWQQWTGMPLTLLLFYPLSASIISQSLGWSHWRVLHQPHSHTEHRLSVLVTVPLESFYFLVIHNVGQR